MRSPQGEELRREERDRNLAMTVEERMAEALRLGEEALQRYMQANGVDRDEAIRRVEHARQSGRRASRCVAEIIDASRPRRTPDPR